jgi:hypothetical protein
LKFFKSARIGSGLGFNKKIYADTRSAPFLPVIPLYLEQTLELSEKFLTLIFDFEQLSLTHLARSRETLTQSPSLFSTSRKTLSLSLSISRSLTLDEREQNELVLLLLLLVLMVMDGWVVGFAGHFGGSFLKISWKIVLVNEA